MVRAVESALLFKEGSGQDEGGSKIHEATSPESLPSDGPKLKYHGLRLQVAIAEPCAPSTLHGSVDIGMSKSSGQMETPMARISLYLQP